MRETSQDPHTKRQSRRSFLKQGALWSGLLFLPGLRTNRAQGIPANDKVNVAYMGLGTRFRPLLDRLGNHNCVALCDVNENAKHWQMGTERHPQAREFADFRKMLDAMDDEIDAVVIATPPHTHFPLAMHAMERGKHVYVEKPMAPTVWEIRELAKAQKKYGVKTQLGNQGQSYNGMQAAREWYEARLCGVVREVHVWSNRGGPGGSPRIQPEAVPSTLLWDLWLGPEKQRPYAPEYVNRWIKFWDFGGGNMLDVGPHTLNTPFYAMDLGAPKAVKAEVVAKGGEACPPASAKVTFEFPAKGHRPEVKVIWFDGQWAPPRPKDLEEGRSLKDAWAEGGSIFLGDKATMVAGGMRPETVRFIPETRMREFGARLQAQKYPRTERGGAGHMMNWLTAIQADGRSNSDFISLGTPLMEVVTLGALAQRVPGQRLEWDSEAMRIANVPEANEYLLPYVREGWNYQA